MADSVLLVAICSVMSTMGFITSTKASIVDISVSVGMSSGLRIS